MKANLTGAAVVPRAELERSFEWIHQVSDLNSDTGVLVTHRDHRDTWRHDSDSSGGGEKPWKQNPLNTQTANMPASHSLCSGSCSGATYFFTLKQLPCQPGRPDGNVRSSVSV